MLALLVDDDVAGRIDPERLEQRLERMVAEAARGEELEAELEVSFRLCGDQAIHELNRDYRHVDRPTDVLAFAMREGDGGDLHPELLGDVIISLDTAARQARGELWDEVLMLAAHGLAHLLGFDHQTDEQEAEMNARVRELLEA